MDADVCSLCSSTDVDCGCQGIDVAEDDSDVVWPGLLRRNDSVWSEIYAEDARSSFDDSALWDAFNRVYEQAMRYGSRNRLWLFRPPQPRFVSSDSDGSL